VCINIAGDKNRYPAAEIISVDALALVRFGLRKADDPHILNTIKAIDGELKVETPNGPCWHRFNHDTYGEDDQGNPCYQSGKGRPWPLLTGERAHYEVAAGRFKEAKKLLQAMDAFSYHGMLPEQIWDGADIPEKGLFMGKHTGSAMPLTWAHAEYVKLCNSIRQKKVFDMPDHTYQRYVLNNTRCNFSSWRFTMQTKKIPHCKEFLRIEVMSPSTVRWSPDGWKTKNDTNTRDSCTGIYIADISLKELNTDEIIFTFFWKDYNKWENKNFKVRILD
jgi:glucoamylase